MENLFLVYKTDAWHSYASRDLIGVATSQQKAISICKAEAKKEGRRFNEDDIYNLDTIGQTQGYKGEGEFHYESVECDTLL